MRKNLTKKLFLSVLTLAFAVVSLGASTYAWFTLSRDAEVKEFEATVQIGSGLQIQAVKKGAAEDEDAWQTASLTISDDLLNGIVLAACTPTEGKFTDAISGAEVKGIHDELTEKEKAGYVCFDLLFKLTDKTDAKEYNLYFDGYTFATDASADNEDDLWTVDKAYSDKNLGQEVFYSVVDAARLRVTGAKGALTYEAQADNAYLSDYYTSGYGLGDDDQNSANDAVKYYNEVNKGSEITPPVAKENVKNSVGTQNGGQLLDTITGGNVYRVTICVWIEGWDGECINAIFNQNLKTTLSFYLDNANE